MQPESGYVSRYLTHFVGRGKTPDEQYAILKLILDTRWLTHHPHDKQPTLNHRFYPQRRFSNNEMVFPEMICFCDIPEGHLAIHSSKYSQFGIVFEKSYLVREGANPVFYVATGSRVLRRKPELRSAEIKKTSVTPAEFESLSRQPTDLSNFAWEPRGQVFDEHLEEFWSLWYVKEELARKTADCRELLQRDMRWATFVMTQVFGFMKFFDESLPEDHSDNFFMEREWRRVGNLSFDSEHVVGVYVPSQFVERFRQECPEFANRVRALSS